MRIVTRIELVDHVEAAFSSGPATRSDLLTAATASHARPEVLAVLQRLRETPYRGVRDLWQELADVPVSA